jgi:hypothetical protein
MHSSYHGVASVPRHRVGMEPSSGGDRGVHRIGLPDSGGRFTMRLGPRESPGPSTFHPKHPKHPKQPSQLASYMIHLAGVVWWLHWP